MSTKHGHNIYDKEILDEFNYGSTLTVTDQLVFSVLEIEKLNFSSLFGIYLHC